MVRVLIVENDPGVRESLALGLSGDFQVEEAEGGELAMSAMDSIHPDVVLVDQNMQGVSGTSLMERLARHKDRPAVVMFSANLDLALVRRAFKLGAGNCISKPFELSAMREALFQAAHKRPASRDDSKPFSMRVAEMLRDGSGEAQGEDLERSLRRFAGQLVEEALVDADGDLERAAARLMLEPEEFKRRLHSLHRGDLSHD